MNAPEWIRAALEGPSGAASDALRWLSAAEEELARGADATRFGALFSSASRRFKRRPLFPAGSVGGSASNPAFEGLTLERWNALEAARVLLVLALPTLAAEAGERALREAFRYADEGEACALYRSLALLPAPERFVWQAGEGCRSNMVSVFEAAALDTPFPCLCFDQATFNQAAVKALFIGAPLWRLYGLDARGNAELARMALDLCDERRSAGRAVQPELWLCLGRHAAQRGLAAARAELDGDTPRAGRAGAGLALLRAGTDEARAELQRRLEAESDEQLAALWRGALEAGATPQALFATVVAL